MGLHLITGYAGKEHITAADQGGYNAGTIGDEKYVLSTGSRFSYEVITNNLIKIRDGELINQGRHIRIPVNDYEECAIDNGIQALKRHDLIVARYKKDPDTGIESAEMIVIKGISAEVASDPEYISGNIFMGDLTDDYPLYRVKLNGLNIEAVEPLFSTLPVYAQLCGKAITTDNISQQTVKSATTLITNAGTATQPVYFSGGKPVACTSYANASVKYADSAGGVAWGNITGKPSKYPPADTGTYYANSKNVAVTTPTWVSGASVTVPAGTYIVWASAYATGGSVRIGISGSPGQWSQSSGGHELAQFIYSTKATSDTNLTTVVYPNYTGSDIIYSRIEAIRFV